MTRDIEHFGRLEIIRLMLIFPFLALLVSVVSAQSIPEGVYAAAKAELNRMKKLWESDPDLLRQSLMFTAPGPRHFEKATLGQMYIALVIHNEDIFKTRLTDDVDLRSLAHATIYCVPVMVDALVVEIMKIQDSKHGAYGVTGSISRGRGAQNIAEIVNSYPRSEGYSVYLSGTLALGNLIIVVFPNNDESLVYALDRKAAETVGAKKLRDEVYDPVLLSEAKSNFYETLVKYKEKHANNRN